MDDWVISHYGIGGVRGKHTKEGSSLPLAQFPLLIRHVERLVNISTDKSYNKIYPYIVEIGREKSPNLRL